MLMYYFQLGQQPKRFLLFNISTLLFNNNNNNIYICILFNNVCDKFTNDLSFADHCNRENYPSDTRGFFPTW